MSGRRDFWVFGYGSLMWRPGFAYLEARPALLHGYHRALCINSIRYRGTPECTGLVVGLDRAGSCRGRAFRVAGADEDAVLDYLWNREMRTAAYIATWLKVATPAGPVRAYTFVVNRANGAQYAGKLPTEEIVARVARGRGIHGSAIEYLENTLRHLDDMGVREGPLHRILEMAKARAAHAAP